MFKFGEICLQIAVLQNEDEELIKTKKEISPVSLKHAYQQGKFLQIQSMYLF